MTPEHTLRSEAVRMIAPLLILAVGVVGFMALKGRRELPVRPAQQKNAPLVDTVEVAAYTDALTIEVDGHVVPYLEAALSAEVAGRVIKKEDRCRAGKFVRRGELLLEIDPADYVLEKKRLTEEREQAESTLKELDVEIADTESLIELANDDVKLRQKDLDRQEKLLSSRASTPATVDQAKSSVLQARNNLLSFRKQLHLLTAKKPRVKSALELIDVRLEQADLDLDRTKVTSPIDGMVVVESVEESSYVQKGSALVTIEDTSAVEVRCHLRMDELCWIWSQTAGEVALDSAGADRLEYQIPQTPVTVVYRLAGQDYTWEGVLWRYDGIGLDERTRTVPCRVLVRAPREVRLRTAGGRAEPPTGPPALVRGMFVNLKIHAKPKANLLRLPEVGVQPGNKVWRVRANRLQTVDVHVVDIVDDAAVVQAPHDVLSAGDKVVVSPLAEVTDGMAVRQRRQDVARSADAGKMALATEERAR